MSIILLLNFNEDLLLKLMMIQVQEENPNEVDALKNSVLNNHKLLLVLKKN